MQTYQNDLSFSLYTILSIYYMVITSDNLMKFKKMLSTDSSIIVYLNPYILF